METVGFHFELQMGQTNPVEGRRQLHNLVILTINKQEISEKEIRKWAAIAQLVLALPFPNHCPSSTPPNNNLLFLFLFNYLFLLVVMYIFMVYYAYNIKLNNFAH